ncbi:hypothetical protein OGAPHI_002202 [Ogataea philodendri]|uniref:Uncharacterized protein n=1 Tax=Ogataea philodendri TaxID=1378263 RepID=A0A9P8T6T6_9ASCO|nr:uncharacterized protein OGAPHI_002202 [Ogataea philodendri]KAH3668448.1 hypothetical protein OGAPHI_002202 [Ogataea philodendri]
MSYRCSANIRNIDADHGPIPLNFCKSRLIVISSVVVKYESVNFTPSGGISSDSMNALESRLTNSAFLYERPHSRSS